jgi:hypothetical protein
MHGDGQQFYQYQQNEQQAHFKSLNIIKNIRPTHTLKIQVMAWDGNKNMEGLLQLMGSQSSPS